jgi:3-dehydroshikimate dehydratase
VSPGCGFVFRGGGFVFRGGGFVFRGGGASRILRGMIKLCAFADEISPDLAEQIRVCKQVGVTHFELRGVYGKNVADFDDALAGEVKAKLLEAGMGVAAIGSPIGKVAIDLPWQDHFARFKRVVQLAEHFNAPLIRLFSYYPPADGTPLSSFREEILSRFRDKVGVVASKNITLVHENEAKIYGEGGSNCLDLMSAINSPKLRMAFDFANFVQCGEKPLENWPALKPYSVHIHVKDAILGTGKVVPAGEGDGQIEPILQDLAASGYSGFLSLEPHLAAHGQFSGFSGPDLFVTAANALRKILDRNHIRIATT